MQIAIYGRSTNDNTSEYIQQLFHKLNEYKTEILIYEPFYSFIKQKLELTGNIKTFSSHTDLHGKVDAMFSLSRRDLLGVLLGGVDLGAEIANGTISVSGDPAKLAELAGYLDEPDPNFAIVTPT